MMKCKMAVVRFDSEDVIATSALDPIPVTPDPVQDGIPTTYQQFQALSQAEKIQLMNEIGEDAYIALVLQLQQEYKNGGIPFGN